MTPERMKANVRYSQVIFDWCQWEWSLTGKRGIWYTDFRFESYSLGLVFLADTEINLGIKFNDTATSAVDQQYFKQCLSLPKRLQVSDI